MHTPRTRLLLWESHQVFRDVSVGEQRSLIFFISRRPSTAVHLSRHLELGESEPRRERDGVLTLNTTSRVFDFSFVVSVMNVHTHGKSVCTSVVLQRASHPSRMPSHRKPSLSFPPRIGLTCAPPVALLRPCCTSPKKLRLPPSLVSFSTSIHTSPDPPPRPSDELCRSFRCLGYHQGQQTLPGAAFTLHLLSGDGRSNTFGDFVFRHGAPHRGTENAFARKTRSKSVTSV